MEYFGKIVDADHFTIYKRFSKKRVIYDLEIDFYFACVGGISIKAYTKRKSSFSIKLSNHTKEELELFENLLINYSEENYKLVKTMVCTRAKELNLKD